VTPQTGIAAGDAALTNVLVPREPLLRWLSTRLPLEAEVSISRVSTGHTNEMFRIVSGQDAWLLRRPPRVALARGAHDMSREFRLLSALRGSSVPHADAVLVCDDSDVIGVPFMIQRFVDGFAPRLPLPEPFTSDAEAQREMAFAMMDELANLARFDWQGNGLSDFGRPDGFLDRQVPRWRSQLDKYRSRDLPYLEEVAGWLMAHRPARSPVGLMHGDYTWSNVMFGHGRPGRVAAIVDWEQSTIGDPLLDLGYLMGLWQEHGEDAHGRDPNSLFCMLPGNASREEMFQRYALSAPYVPERVEYYQVLALFKLGCIMEGSYYRHRNGTSDDPVHATLKTRVPSLFRRAARIAGVGE
jgi:aminoglycoside phosphotransferase (APT) family kinase protein